MNAAKRGLRATTDARAALAKTREEQPPYAAGIAPTRLCVGAGRRASAPGGFSRAP